MPAVMKPKLKDLLPSRQEWRDSVGPIGRGSVLGFLIGIVPGSAHIISSFVSYAVERRISKHPERFGHGAVKGVAGPESANNSATSGALVPMLALGVPLGAGPRCDDGGLDAGSRLDAVHEEHLAHHVLEADGQHLAVFG